MAGFLQRRWVRIAGLIPAAIFVFLSYWTVVFVLRWSLLRTPNHVFAITDLISFIGYAVFLVFLFGSGVISILMARFMGGFYRVLYITGLVTVLASTIHFPMTLIYGADWNSYPKEVPSAEALAGTWCNSYMVLELHRDSTYSLTLADPDQTTDSFTPSSGTWYLERNKLHLTDLNFTWPSPWWIVTSEGRYFIRYEFPGNPDAWSGNLGLMRESDWNGI